MGGRLGAVLTSGLVRLLGSQKHQPCGRFIRDAPVIELGTMNPCEGTAVVAAVWLHQKAMGFDLQILSVVGRFRDSRQP